MSESQEFIESMLESDKRAFVRDKVREMEREGKSEVQIQAFLLRGSFAPGLTSQGVMEK